MFSGDIVSAYRSSLFFTAAHFPDIHLEGSGRQGHIKNVRVVSWTPKLSEQSQIEISFSVATSLHVLGLTFLMILQRG